MSVDSNVCGAVRASIRRRERAEGWPRARGSGEDGEKFVVLRAVCCLSFVHDCTRHADPPLSAAATAGATRTRTQRRWEEGRGKGRGPTKRRERRAPAIAAASRHAVRRHRFFFGVCCAHALWSGCAVGEAGQRRPSGCSTGKRDAARPRQPIRPKAPPDVDPTRPREHNNKGEKKKQVGGAEGGEKGAAKEERRGHRLKNVHQRKEKKKGKNKKKEKLEGFEVGEMKPTSEQKGEGGREAKENGGENSGK